MSRHRIIKELMGLRFWWVSLLVLQVTAFLAIGLLVRTDGAGEADGRHSINDSLDMLRAVHVGLGILQIAIFHLIATSSIGSEFSTGAIERVLAQPVPRGLYWSEKLATIGLILIVTLMGNLSLSFFSHGSFGSLYPLREITDPVLAENALRSLPSLWEWLQFMVLFTLCGAFLSIGTGPAVAVLLRQTHTAFAMSLILPVLTALLLVGIDSMFLHPVFGISVVDRLISAKWTVQREFNLMIAFTVAWVPIISWIGWRSFKRLEV